MAVVRVVGVVVFPVSAIPPPPPPQAISINVVATSISFSIVEPYRTSACTSLLLMASPLLFFATTLIQYLSAVRLLIEKVVALAAVVITEISFIPM